MQGIVLGSGTGVPSLQRNAPGYFLQAGERQCLIDCGSGTLLQLLRVNRSHRMLDEIFITHIHGDHIGDLIPLMHALRMPGLSRDKPLTIHGPPGFPDFFQRIVTPVVAPPERFPFQVREIGPRESFGDLVVTSLSTPHSDRFASRAYRFERAGKSVVFSGDTDHAPELAAFFREADILILECSTLDADKVAGHLSAGLCGRIATEAGVRRLILTHFYPIEGPDSRFLEECRRHFTGAVEMATDLMPFTAAA